MTAWVSASQLGEEDFAARYFGAPPDRLGIDHFRNAAESVAFASSFAEMREAAGEVAAGMMAVGLDHWPHVLREARNAALLGFSPVVQSGGDL